jgi:sugar transferase (PEP-CTERM/EpsH1 system associated)
MAEYIFRSKVLNKRRAGQPKLVMDFMDLDSDKWIQYAKSSKSILKIVYQREAKLLEKYEARIVKHFNDCFLISHAEVEAFEISICKSNKLHVMGNGIDLDVFYPNANKSFDPVGPVLLFTGVMDYKPNIDAVSWLAGKVWFRLLELYPNIRLIISGMNPTPAVRKLSEIQGIEVTGFVEDILPYYHKSDIFVAPLQIARGVQNKILQAMASGLPVISSSMGAEGINCESGTHILIADTPDQFIQHLNALVNEPEFRNSLISHARKLVEEQYSWASNLAILENVLKKR